MDSKRISQLQIGIALIFAGIVFLLGILMKGSEHYQTIIFVLFAIWFVPFSYYEKIKTKNSKTNCL